MNIGEIELEYNVAGGLLLTLTPGDLQTLCDDLVNASYSHGCIFPFRGFGGRGTSDKLKNLIFPLSVAHIELPWNPTPYDSFPAAVFAGSVGQVRRFLGDKNQPPILQDALFPSKETSERMLTTLLETFPEAAFISHLFPSSWDHPNKVLVKAHAGLNLSSPEILERCQTEGHGLVFDPSHLLNPSQVVSMPDQPVRESRGKWERQLTTLASRVGVVDINSPERENDVRDLLRRKGLYTELAMAARENPNVRFLRVEIPMPIRTQIPFYSPWQQEGFEYLRDIANALKEA